MEICFNGNNYYFCMSNNINVKDMKIKSLSIILLLLIMTLPACGSGKGGEDVKTIAYEQFIPLLTTVIQMLDKNLITLEKRIEDLENK